MPLGRLESVLRQSGYAERAPAAPCRIVVAGKRSIRRWVLRLVDHSQYPITHNENGMVIRVWP